ncbi:MAG: hypothetical protein IKB50_03060 [Clostridia bacterium]|nr:hypothetical protein [Clostridia bacterium]
MIKLDKNETLVFLGDSISDGARGRSMDLNHILGHGFVEMVCARLGADNYENTPKFVNKGVSGETLQHVYAHLGRDCLAYKPGIINILAGVNDSGSWSDGLTEDMVVARYTDTMERIVADAREVLPDVKIVVCEPFYTKITFDGDPYENIPHHFCEEYRKFGNVDMDEETNNRFHSIVSKMQKVLPDLCRKLNVIFVPLQDKFDEAAKTTHMSYFIWDNVHPTTVGHRLIADRWFEVVENELNKK